MAGFSLSHIAILAALVGAQASAQTAALEQCPAFAVCDANGCTEAPADGSVRFSEFHGVRIPDARTNYPVINAGVRFLKRYGSEEYLLAALAVVCRPARQELLPCSGDLASGQMPGSMPDHDVADIWSAVGYVPGASITSASARELESCQEYTRISRTVGDALKPDVALQSATLSEEGIRTRVNLMKLFSFRPIIESRCQEEASGAEGAMAVAIERQCTGLRSYFDDVRFALLLADKQSLDGKIARAWGLLRATDRSATLMGAIATAPRTGKDHPAFVQSLARLLNDDWTQVRSAIEQALAN